ncbi:MAG: diguanylate cyclase [Deltaproteobacteria bacterium]|nr:diguanylate cyclase [Deltaproteobacteria bacterium]
MLGWLDESVARKAAAIAGISAATGIGLLAALLPWLAPGPARVLVASGAALLGGAIAAAISSLVMRRLVVRRLARLTEAVEQMERGEVLSRPEVGGNDEIAQTSAAFARLAQRILALNIDVFDRTQVLEETQEALRLKEALAAKTALLEHRLSERAMLFETLRYCVSSLDLDEVLGFLADRAGQAVGAREVAVLVATDLKGDRYALRGAWGFAAPQAVLGRTLSRGEGIAGTVAEARQPLVVADVALEPDYLAFWGLVERAGSFAAVPLLSGGELVGLLCLTHAAPRAFDATRVRLLSAFADQAALAVRNAQLYAAMRELSVTDELTGLANRRRLMGRLEREWARRERTNEPIAVLAVDVDHFKQLNDRSGHPVGDAALRTIAGVLASQVRRVDTVARVGGEEFVVLLVGAGPREALEVAEKLRARVAATAVPGCCDQPGGRVTISLGVAVALGSDTIDPTTLLARADEALYAAKRHGRDRVELWRP